MSNLVDLVVLTRDDKRFTDEFQTGIENLKGVKLELHRVVGRTLATDRCRRETIARARNKGKTQGNSPWVMFLDDDVVLPPDSIMKMLSQLNERPVLGAVAADYLAEAMKNGVAPHVGMGATLFRREALDRITFRWEPHQCECLCCCHDLRSLHIGIDYAEDCPAEHLSTTKSGWHPGQNMASLHRAKSAEKETSLEPRIMAAFNRRDFSRFCSQFLPTLRAHGNHEIVTAITYGLFPSQRRTLDKLVGVEVLPYPNSEDEGPTTRRLLGFQTALAGLNPRTPVAYWDAGDVLFQGSLDELWREVEQNPSKLAAVSETLGYPENKDIVNWLQRIRDPQEREKVDALLTGKPMLNAGFLASTAATMQNFFQAARRLIESPTLLGAGFCGDQLALNVFCHQYPEKWIQLNSKWNYCLLGRALDRMQFKSNVLYHDGVDRSQIKVVHGNGGSLRHVLSLDHHRLTSRVWP